MTTVYVIHFYAMIWKNMGNLETNFCGLPDLTMSGLHLTVPAAEYFFRGHILEVNVSSDISDNLNFQ